MAINTTEEKIEEKPVTCQICARIIKAKNGIIAHHGYKRPNRGSGWQTNSCAGARHLPYEVSCDVLPPTIVAIKAHISLREGMLADLITNPPQSFTFKKSYYSKEETVVTKPDNFDPKVDWCYRMFTYESQFCDVRNNYRQDIKFAQIDLKFMENRLANWVAPK